MELFPTYFTERLRFRIYSLSNLTRSVTRPRIVERCIYPGLGGSSHGGVGAFADGKFVTFHTGDDKVSTKKPSRVPPGS